MQLLHIGTQNCDRFSSGELRAGLYINDKSHAKTYFDMLLQEKAQIELEIGMPACVD